ncbi:MAG: hypothetical protein LQ346_006282 [Caloplaca aetnensis]|nr:MAG: hypothetical protein LQ346_006282 [Caloplaca aetnensis]
MNSQDLIASFDALTMDHPKESHPFIRQTLSNPACQHSITIRNPNPFAFVPPIFLTSSPTINPGKNMILPPNNEWVQVSVPSPSPHTNANGETNLCTAIDCPCSNIYHYKGYFLYNPTPGRPVRFHEDFGYSDPPPSVWAAYLRATDCFEELDNTNARSDEGFLDIMMENPWGDSSGDDQEKVITFLKYHAVTVKEIDGRMELVPLKGRILSGEDPKILNLLRRLAL